MEVERTFVGDQTFISLFIPLLDNEIDRIIEQQSNLEYNGSNANTSHSEGVA
ncbi:hypothetical protein [Aneurinibacillus sp. XH2]|uniref:hypothetical protein n=1 Tax=Aneurinibacillus sp. XH2 TaxID=1450761 RepID=UPI000AF2735C|nr:hypothetical protein [Aneurinibacillus sp. XH2]